MEILIDTNVFIEREGDGVVPEPLQELENLLKTKGHAILIHPLSKEEIQKYEDEQGREMAESKIATYPELSFPEYPTPSDTEFRGQIPEGNNHNEQVDNALLFSVFRSRVDLLVTQDRGIHSKAELLGLEERVLTIEQARDRFDDERPAFERSPSIEKLEVKELDVGDPIFDSLKQEYDDFEGWFNGIPERDAYVNWNRDGTLGAVLILKTHESESIGEMPALPRRERLKICTMKVAPKKRGSKIGELLISISVREAIQHGLEEIYLTHRVRENDYLVQLISKYGFERASEEEDGEGIFVKRLTPGPGDNPDPLEVNIRFYPSFYDGESVKKFLVPITSVFS